MTKRIALGVDVGGTGIKAAPVNLKNGKFVAERYRIPTPQPSTPKAVVKAIARCINQFKPGPEVPIGVTFPGVILHGVVMTAANVDDAWVGVDLQALIRDQIGRDVTVLNDGDAAGYGEFKYGAANGEDGVVFLATLGTGIGTALIADGQLVANTEFGHLIINGEDAEEYAAESARTRHDLDWGAWTGHLQRYFDEIEKLLWPDLIIVGGGISKSHHMFLPNLKLRAPIVPAELLNGAGIVGAAAVAALAHQRGQLRAKDLNNRNKQLARKAAQKGQT
jgi:polyphosphate glucokinase